jgi:hypothetical protein
MPLQNAMIESGDAEYRISGGIVKEIQVVLPSAILA